MGLKAKSIWRWIRLPLVALYVLVALLNSSVVQSYLGAVAGSYFSREWGGKVRIGALHFSPISHVILDHIELISPTNDTLFYGDRITCRFKKLPFYDNGLHFDRVKIKHSTYHFQSIRYADGKMGTNLDFIIKYYVPEPKPRNPNPKLFTVEVGEVVIDDVNYIMDLPEIPGADTSWRAEYQEGPRPVIIPHMRYNHILGRIRNLKVVNDHVKCDVATLATEEASGMTVKDLAAQVEVSSTLIETRDMRLVTGSSTLLCDVRMDYDGWESMKDYCNNVYHEIVLKHGSRVNVNESGWWAPLLWGVDCPVDIEGHVYGTIADMHVDSLRAAFGEESHLMVDGKISGLPLIGNTRFDATVSPLHITYADAAEVRLPYAAGVSWDKGPFTLFKTLDFVDATATMLGDAGDCKMRLAMNTGVGDISADAAIQYDADRKDCLYVGDIRSKCVGIHSLAPNEWVSRTGVHLSFEGHGIRPETLSASLVGELTDVNLRGNELSHATLTATLDKSRLKAEAAIDDSLLCCKVRATSHLDDHTHSLDVRLDEAHLTRLNLVKDIDSDLVVSTRLRASLQEPQTARALDIEHLSGTVSLNDTRCHVGSRQMLLKELKLILDNHGDSKNIHVDCDWFDMGVKGYFDYADIPLMVQDFSRRYLPRKDGKQDDNEIPNGTQNPIGDPDQYAKIADNTFDIDMVWNDAEGTFAQLQPGFALASGTALHGNYNYTESLKLIFRSDEITFGSVSVHDIGLHTNTQGGYYSARLKSGDISVAEIPLFQDLRVGADMGSRTSSFSLQWDDDAAMVNNHANLEFFLTEIPHGHKLMITRPELYVLGERWNLVCPDGILFVDSTLEVSSLKFYGDNQSLALKASVGHGDEDFVNMSFHDFSLGRIGELLLAQNNIKVVGVLDGAVELHSMSTNPYFVANLSVDEMAVNDQSTGKMDIRSNWDADEKRIYLDLTTEKHFPDRVTHPIELHGSVLVDGSNDMDMEIDMHRISLQVVGPMLTDFTSNINGYLSGAIYVHGTPDDLTLNGQAQVTDGLLQVDVTGVTYYFEDTLTISNDTLKLHNFAIHDASGNTTLANGNIIYHQPELLLDLDVSTPRIMVLDSKPAGDNFYGRLLVKSDGSVSGSVAHPVINVRATTMDGSELHVPVNNKLQVAESDYIHFVSYDRDRSRTVAPAKPASNLTLQLDLTVTPGVKLFLPMDFTEITADVRAVGNGDVRLMIDGAMPTVLGNYTFSSGQFKMSLLQLIEKNFSIQEGGTLTFPGSLDDARFDIKAVYSQRVNLASLTGTAGLSGSDTYTQVENVIALAGTLKNPSLKFDIRLPNADQSVIDQVNSVINLSNDQDMLNQTVSLLLLGRFANTMGNSDNEGGFLSNGLSSINVLASSLSSLVTSAVKVVDVNFKLQQGAVAGSTQIDVGVSKQWDKFYFESTFGYGTGNTSEMNNIYSNVLMGDVVLGYKLSPYFSVYGFDRTNTSYYTRSEIPYKQGLGLKWSRDFNTVHDLFPWIRKSKQNP